MTIIWISLFCVIIYWGVRDALSGRSYHSDDIYLVSVVSKEAARLKFYFESSDENKSFYAVFVCDNIERLPHLQLWSPDEPNTIYLSVHPGPDFIRHTMEQLDIKLDQHVSDPVLIERLSAVRGTLDLIYNTETKMFVTKNDEFYIDYSAEVKLLSLGKQL